MFFTPTHLILQCLVIIFLLLWDVLSWSACFFLFDQFSGFYYLPWAEFNVNALVVISPLVNAYMSTQREIDQSEKVQNDIREAPTDNVYWKYSIGYLGLGMMAWFTFSGFFSVFRITQLYKA